MAITPQGEAARALLASLPEFSSGDKPVAQLSDAYAQRLASGARRQLASGVTPSRQAARGHILTPEHGAGAARPQLPEQAENYRAARKSITAAATTGAGATPSAPAQRRTAALEPENRRPLLHRRQRGEGHIPFGDGGEIYTENHADAARRIVAYAAELNGGAGERLTMQVYDCSRGRWFAVFHNPGHGSGINAKALLEKYHDHGGSWEQFLMDTVNGASYNDRGRVTHICQYELTILPRDIPAVTALKKRLGKR
jgi:hypothetical protein